MGFQVCKVWMEGPVKWDWTDSKALEALMETKVKHFFSIGSNLRMLRFMGTPSCFFISFTKGNNYHKFLFVSSDNEALPKMGSALKGKNLLLEEQILLFQS